MATVEERYASAIAYVQQAIAHIEHRSSFAALVPLVTWIDLYAERIQTETPRHELARIEARWRAAHTAEERSTVTHDAEQLADHVEESLPGAPQDRVRTNRYPGEPLHATPPSRYLDELQREVHSGWSWMTEHVQAVTEQAGSVGRWLLLGGGLAVGWRLLDAARAKEASSQSEERRLRTNLARAATRRHAT